MCLWNDHSLWQGNNSWKALVLNILYSCHFDVFDGILLGCYHVSAEWYANKICGIMLTDKIVIIAVIGRKIFNFHWKTNLKIIKIVYLLESLHQTSIFLNICWIWFVCRGISVPHNIFIMVNYDVFYLFWKELHGDIALGHFKNLISWNSNQEGCFILMMSVVSLTFNWRKHGITLYCGWGRMTFEVRLCRLNWWNLCYSKWVSDFSPYNCYRSVFNESVIWFKLVYLTFSIHLQKAVFNLIRILLLYNVGRCGLDLMVSHQLAW